MPKEIPKAYDAKAVEAELYSKWEQSGFFNPDKLPGKRTEPFCIIMPPPNANGSLHAGHAVFVTLEDLMTRFKRMQGYKALWLPGADHAGFETQVVYERKLEEEGKSRLGMDPDILRKEILDFTLSNKRFMEGQLRQLGASCDWSREVFTLDEKVIKVVYDTFKQLETDGLLYRGNRSVNWCTKHQTSLADLEQQTVDQTDNLYYIEYGPFTVATVRPETIFGDVAIAVNPDDKRYAEFIGNKVAVKTPIGEMELEVIADGEVDMEFGTGALKITPAHDANDFALAGRHNLRAVEVIDEHGILNEKTGKYQGQNINEARENVAADLKEMGLLKKVEPYEHAIPTCYKCGTTLEPRILPQWFIKMEPLAKRALEAVKKGDTEIVTKKFEKTFYNWMENINDWNISRQIVWGIPIPAKICTECGHGMVDLEDAITECTACKGTVEKDADTFDTWFSSGQFPFATLGYPDSDDYKMYYSTDVMETAADIIFFWVARMLMLGLYRTGKVPFKYVYLHGLVKDAKGQKMSKSKGNVINPIELSEKYGTDALRLGLVIGNSPGNDMNLSEDKIDTYKKFANKLWNISRYILLTIEDPRRANESPQAKTLADEWILGRLDETIIKVTEDLEQFRFSVAAENLLKFTWDDFADWYLEISKIEGDKDAILFEVLNAILKMWHPFAPFVTEAIWQELTDGESMLMVEPWVKPLGNNAAREGWSSIQEIVTQIRHFKNTYKIPPSSKIPVLIHAQKSTNLIEEQKVVIETLAQVSIEQITTETIKTDAPSIRFAVVSKQAGIISINLLVEGVLDIVKEKARVEDEIAKLEKYTQVLKSKLDGDFSSKAPEKVVALEREKLHDAGAKILKCRDQLETLS